MNFATQFVAVCAAAAHIQVFGDVYTPQSVLDRTGTAPETPALFGEAREVLDAASFNLVNLEGAITSAFVPLEPKRFLLKMPLTVPRILRAAGIDGVTLANNHSMDYGLQGLHDTLWTLRDAGMLTAGAGATLADALRPMIVPAGDTSLCILSFARVLPESFWASDTKPGTAFASVERVRTEIDACARQGLLPIAVFHWGSELHHVPRDYQRTLAHAAIDAGAAAVLGHHPHVLQGSEIYKNRLVVYSLGNFAFGSLPNGSDPEGLAVRLSVESSTLRYELVPLVVDNDVVRFRPRPYAVGEEKKAKKVIAAPKECSWSDATLRWTCVLPRPESRSAYASGDDSASHLRR